MLNLRRFKSLFDGAPRTQHGQLTAKQYIKLHRRDWISSYPTQLFQIVIRPGITAIIVILSVVNFIKFYSSSHSLLVATIQLDLLANYLVAYALYKRGYKKLFLAAMQAFPLVMACGWISENALLYRLGETTPPNDLKFGTVIAVIWLLSFSNKTIQAYAFALFGTISCFVGFFLIDQSFIDFDKLENFVEPFAVGIFLNYLLARLIEYRFYSSRQNKAIKGIFDSSKSALFTVSLGSTRDIYIDVDRSPAFYTLLGKANAERLRFRDHFLSKADLSPPEKSHLIEVLSTILKGDSFTYELNSDNLPLAVKLQVNESKRYVSINWEPMFNDHGLVERLTVSASDITEQWQAEMERDNAQSKTKALLELIAAAKSPSIRFIRSTFEALERIRDLEAGSNLLTKVDDILGLIHSIKGDSRTLKLTRITDEAHLAESKIMSLRASEPESLDAHELHSSIQGLLQSVFDYKMILENDLSWLHTSDDKIEVSYGFLREIFMANKSKALEISELISTLSEDNALAKESMKLLNSVLPQVDLLMCDALSQFKDTAASLGRPLPDLKVVGGLIRFSPLVNASLNSVLTQFISNALDHGIEKPDARIVLGKPKNGLISVHVSKIDGYYRITWQDDGQGIDLDKVTKSARSVGVDVVGMADYEIAQLILKPRLTTKSEATQVSGRGLGLHTVVTHLAAIDGRVSVELIKTKTSNVYEFLFVILIPEELVFMDFNKKQDEILRSA